MNILEAQVYIVGASPNIGQHAGTQLTSNSDIIFGPLDVGKFCNNTSSYEVVDVTLQSSTSTPDYYHDRLKPLFFINCSDILQALQRYRPTDYRGNSMASQEDMSSATKEVLSRVRQLVPPMLDTFHKGPLLYISLIPTGMDIDGRIREETNNASFA